ncbi:hypothetical protein [Burkholderia sp. PAMC 26561]|uniref:hypothetical protein n=1 Tax=Burkholderia sp. PAMC 26561 TaxID=1795043 RepID=UPI0013C433E6|nr:hypothetical protein [Burkholderia sp. PAMC 26561]
MKNRTPHELRVDFILISAENIPVSVALAKFGRLWDETNAAASQLVSSEDIGDYITVLRDMDVWYQRAKKLRPRP